MATSLNKVAHETAAAFAEEEHDGGFAFLRGAHDQLLAVYQDPGIEPAFKLASFAVADFCDRVLDDLTKAVPWDEARGIGEARGAARQLLQKAFASLDKATTISQPALGLFSELGFIRSEYEQLIEQLNNKDRRTLATLGRQ